MKTLIEKVFGVNWKTTVWGWLCTLSAAAAVNPAIFDDFLPETWVKPASKFFGIVAVISGGTFAVHTKASNVSGNKADGYSVSSGGGKESRDIAPEAPPVTTQVTPAAKAAATAAAAAADSAAAATAATTRAATTLIR